MDLVPLMTTPYFLIAAGVIVVGTLVAIVVQMTRVHRLAASDDRQLAAGSPQAPGAAARDEPAAIAHGGDDAPHKASGTRAGEPPHKASGGRAGEDAEPITTDRPTVTFADLAGLEGAVEDLSDVREYLADPERYRALGAEPPRGVLLQGPPGCGKTLLARALAGETGVAFFSVSAASFVEQYVGVGAARVRKLFKKAQAAAPAIVFIDELDAVGGHRNADAPGTREFDHTLNQLLVELDGFLEMSGVLVLAATNRAEMLDEALLRAGRFDRRIPIDPPSRAGREQILRLHAAKRSVAREVDWEQAAEDTAGLTGADLASLVNEAALLAARRRHHTVCPDDVEAAVVRVQSGPPRSRALGSEEKWLLAVHEAGHALLAGLVPGLEPPSRVSIGTRAMGGRGTWTHGNDSEVRTKQQLCAELVVLLGGRAAELETFDDPSTHAEDDLREAAQLADEMVTRWSMTGRFDLAGPGSRQTRPQVEGSAGGREIKELVTWAERTARTILSAHRTTLLDVAAQLVERETLPGSEILALTRSMWEQGAAVPRLEGIEAEPSSGRTPSTILAS